MGVTGRLRLTGGAQPIFRKQLKFYPTVFLRLLMDGGPIKKYAQTTPSADGVSAFLLHQFILINITIRGGLAIVAMRQLPRGFFFENAKLFLRLRAILKIFAENLRLF
jgi:hypothetical protein